MNTFLHIGRNATKLQRAIALVLGLAIFLWATGAPSWLPFARAAALTTISDTLSDSDLSATSDHAWAFTTTAALDQNDTIVFTLDPTTSLFLINNLSSADVTGESGLDVVAACGGGSNELTMATTSVTITLTVCAGDTIAAGAKTLTFDNARIRNPGVADSYIMRVRTTNDGSTTRDQADTRVVILDDVLVTASVDTIFEFTVAGVAANQTINGDSGTTTAITTTATALPFGTLQPGEDKLLAQQLTVETNAAGGFTVTVVQDQVLTSATGADIDNFIDGGNTPTPAAWQSPAGTLGSENTYGHFGVTSEDSTLSAGDEFGTALYAGNINTPREVFYHDDVADASTAHIGLTRVGYKIEIDSLQEAGSDYTMTLTYVATPRF
jgi:hypothetical protein